MQGGGKRTKERIMEGGSKNEKEGRKRRRNCILHSHEKMNIKN